ncbi:hypothetical protein GCM10009611_09970 [Arthrobacter roseus]
MSLDPGSGWPVLLAMVLLMLGFALLQWMLARRQRRLRSGAWLVRAGIAVLVALALLRPGVGDADTGPAAAADVDVFILVDTTEPEIAFYSQGSSVSRGRDLLRDSLSAAYERRPDRARLVYYLGDGEHTTSSPPERFDVVGSLVTGGAVLG